MVDGACCRHEQEARGASGLPRTARQHRRGMTSLALELGIDPLERGQRLRGGGLRLGGPCGEQHRISGQGVVKAEAGAFDVHELRVHAASEQLRGGALVHAGSAGGDGPVEVAPERRGALQQADRLGGKGREAQRDRRGDRARHRVVDRRPARWFRGREQLLDEERHALAPGLQRGGRVERQVFADDVASHRHDVVGVEGMQDDGVSGPTGNEGVCE